MILPNELINIIVNMLPEVDKVHFALTCKTWMEWVRYHIIFTKPRTIDVIKHSSFTFTTLELSDGLPPHYDHKKIMSITKVVSCSIWVRSYEGDSQVFRNIIDEWVRVLTNVKKIKIDWSFEFPDFEKLMSLINYKLCLPVNIKTLKIDQNFTFSSEDPPTLWILGEDENLIHVPFIVFKGDTITIPYMCFIYYVIINSKYCRHLDVLSINTLSKDTIENIETLTCNSSCFVTSESHVFESLVELNITLIESSMEGAIIYELFKKGMFPKLKVLTMQGLPHLLDNLDLPSLEVINLQVWIDKSHPHSPDNLDLPRLELIDLDLAKEWFRDIGLFKLNNPDVTINVEE